MMRRSDTLQRTGGMLSDTKHVNTTRAPLRRTHSASERSNEDAVIAENAAISLTSRPESKDDGKVGGMAARSRADLMHKKLAGAHEQYVKARAEQIATRTMLDDLGAKGHTMDVGRWRRKVGIEPGVKVFVITGLYPDVRDALLSRGWKQNPDVESPHFDMKWTLKSSEVNYQTFQPQQIGNHFAKAGNITTKAGLIHSLRNVNLFTEADQHSFYPRAYDLGDSNDYADFVDDFRCIEAEKVLRQIVDKVVHHAMKSCALTVADLLSTCSLLETGGSSDVARIEVILARLMSSDGDTFAKVFMHRKILESFSDSQVAVNKGVMKAALSVSMKRCQQWIDDQLDNTVSYTVDSRAVVAAEEGLIIESEPVVTNNEWEILRYCNIFSVGGPVQQAPTKRKFEYDARERERLENLERERLLKEASRAAKTGTASLEGIQEATTGAGDDEDMDGDVDDSSSEDSLPEDVPSLKKLPPGFPSKAARSGAPSKKVAADPENPDSFNNGTVSEIRFRDRGAVAAVQLRIWRERLMRDGGDAEIYSESLGNPAATVSMADDPAFATCALVTMSEWEAIIQALARINATTSAQVTLNANPPQNIWIVKPAGKSRGRGIECERTLAEILSNRGGDGHKEQAWICQRYIERPLLVRGFKWDIRQWVLVSSWNPLTVWFYDKCYLRFCSYPFELHNLSNRYIHLSNNSIQKHSVAFEASEIEGNMWHVQNFANWLQDEASKGAWDGLAYTPDAPAMRGDCNNDSNEAEAPDCRPISSCRNIWREVLQPKMRRIVAWSLQAAQDRIEHRAGSFEVYGYDFMVDADLHPWLIEINASPDFSYSTGVTETLVKQASEDAMKVVVDYAAWEASRVKKPGVEPVATGAPDTGDFQCIFRSPVTLPRTLTCTAHGIVCTGSGIRPPGTAKRAAPKPGLAAPVTKAKGRPPVTSGQTEPKKTAQPAAGGREVDSKKSGARSLNVVPGAASLSLVSSARESRRFPAAERAVETVRSARVLIPLATSQITTDLPEPVATKPRSASASKSRRSTSASMLPRAAFDLN